LGSGVQDRPIHAERVGFDPKHFDLGSLIVDLTTADASNQSCSIIDGRLWLEAGNPPSWHWIVAVDRQANGVDQI
jgi:hypothetical protein